MHHDLTAIAYTATQAIYAALNAERDFYHAMTGQWYTFNITHQPDCKRRSRDQWCTCTPEVDKSTSFPWSQVRR
jgi:hypothetical protein